MRTKEATEVWELFRDTCTGPKEPVRKLLRNLDERLAELEAYNTRLRSCLEDAAENERLTTHEFNQLKEQRDKLRELVRDVVLLAGIAGCDVTNMQMHVHGGDWHTVRERMEELGVDV